MDLGLKATESVGKPKSTDILFGSVLFKGFGDNKQNIK